MNRNRLLIGMALATAVGILLGLSAAASLAMFRLAAATAGAADTSPAIAAAPPVGAPHSPARAVAQSPGAEPEPPALSAARPVAPVYWGVAMQAIPWDMPKLEAWEANVSGKAPSIISWGHFWGEGDGYRAWSSIPADNARAHGSIPMITWTPEGGDKARWTLRSIVDGEHDLYIRQFATDAREWGHPFFLRVMHEMNGAWGYPWQEDANGNARGEFVPAWRHIVDIFRSVGATNASFVWCPNVDYPGSPRPTLASVYPGDDYVDWTCLDGYNWGSNRSSGWQTFDQIYGYSYSEILGIAPSKPLMIGELGSAEQGGSKGAWISDALAAQIPLRYPSIRAHVWFDWQFDGTDWRVETSESSQLAWRTALSASYYLANDFARLDASPIPPPAHR